MKFVKILVAAGLAQGRKLTCYEHVKSEVTSAGGEWIGQECPGWEARQRADLDLPPRLLSARDTVPGGPLSQLTRSAARAHGHRIQQ